MPEVKNAKHIGMRRAAALANLTLDQQLDLIYEGLPALMGSVEELLSASKALSKNPRSAAILNRHATEEIAKILILVDLVRCPNQLRASKTGVMIKWFYSHLARLIYVDAQSWKPMTVQQLQEYVDTHRPSHYLEGAIGEYIAPNFEIFKRESDMYADILCEEDGTLHWHDPNDTHRNSDPDLDFLGNDRDPWPWKICLALRDLGLFTREGLGIMSDAWSKTDFCDQETWHDAKGCVEEMLVASQSAGLITENAKENQAGTLYHSWQMPMYHLEFSQITVSLEELRAQQEHNLAMEMGY